jgi:hypothetical protein
MTTDDTRPDVPLDVPLEPEPGSTAVTSSLVASPAAPPPVRSQPVARRSPRMRTLVLGLVLAAVSVTTLVHLLTDVNVDGGAVALGVILVAGVLLVAGGVASATRDARATRDGT